MTRPLPPTTDPFVASAEQVEALQRELARRDFEIARLRATLALPHHEWAAGMHSVGVDIEAEDKSLRARLALVEPVFEAAVRWHAAPHIYDANCIAGREAEAPPIDWIIAGCESGPRSRPCDVEWLRSLRDQCAAARVAFFLKQAAPGLGGLAHDVPDPKPIDIGRGSKWKPGAVIELPYLDGVQHAEFPGGGLGGGMSDQPFKCCPRFSWGDGTHDLDCRNEPGFWGRAAARLSIENKKLRASLRRACDIGLRLSKSAAIDSELKALYPSGDES